MKIVIAPDSFKGALSSPEVAAALAAGWHARRPEDEIVTVPLADGGEGTCVALVTALDGEFGEFAAHDPLMRSISGVTGILPDGTAVVEMASASGLERLKSTELDPLRTTTFGSGELIKALLQRGVRQFLIGLGGSATVDGGVGLLQALGWQFFDAQNVLLPPGAGGGSLAKISRVDDTKIESELADCHFKIACDVTNPLTGENGAAAVFGPQKGATLAQVKELDANLAQWARLWKDAGNTPGDGAAGGLGFMFRRVLHGELVSGAQLVIEAAHLKEKLSGAKWLITGEGCSDAQTASGKLCAVAAACARQAGVPTILCSGALKELDAALTAGFAGCFSIAPGAINLEQALRDTAKNLYHTAYALAGVVAR